MNEIDLNTRKQRRNAFCFDVLLATLALAFVVWEFLKYLPPDVRADWMQYGHWFYVITIAVIAVDLICLAF